MSVNAVVPIADQLAAIPAFQMSDDELMDSLESSTFPGAKKQSIKLVVARCKAMVVDPFLKPFHIVPMCVKKGSEYEWRDVVMPGVGFYRIIAARSGHAGTDEGQFGPTVEFSFKQENGNDGVLPVPEWCSVMVYRIIGGLRCGFSSGKCWWTENYATASNKTKAPNSMWSRRPFQQLEKCAEALALRKAFPEVGTQPTAEEMEGRETFDIDAPRPEAAERVRPQPKAESKPLDVDPETGEIIPPPKEPDKPKVDSPKADSPKAPAPVIAMVRKKAQQAAIDERLIARHHETPTLDDITIDTANVILANLRKDPAIYAHP